MKELIIKGTDEYINYMKNHLSKEHPETKKKMTVKKININENLIKDSDLNDLMEI